MKYSEKYAICNELYTKFGQYNYGDDVVPGELSEVIGTNENDVKHIIIVQINKDTDEKEGVGIEVSEDGNYYFIHKIICFYRNLWSSIQR